MAATSNPGRRAQRVIAFVFEIRTIAPDGTIRGMRSFTLSVLAAFAVFFTALSAHAQGMGRCLNRPMVAMSASTFSRELAGEAKTPAKDSSFMASRMVERLRVAREVYAAHPMAGQSRAPIVCVDPNTPGCQIEVPDAPHHHTFGALAWDAARAVKLFEGIPPADCTACVETPYVAGPRDGHAPSSWRPPSA